MPVSLPDWPTTKQEGWRYTNLKALAGLTLATGQTMLESSATPQGLTLAKWDGIPNNLPQNNAVARAVATVDAGWKLSVTAPVATPFELTFNNIGDSTAPRLAIHVAKNAELTLIERHAQGAQSLTNMIGEIVLEDGAKLTHVRLQQCDQTATHLDTRSVHVSGNASYRHFAFVQGAGISRYEPLINLQGEGAEADFSALMLLMNNQQADLTTHLQHAQPRGNSNQSVRAVLAHRAQGTYQGRIAVAPYAKLSDAQQLSRALLLSPEAQMNAKPELEILNDDVKCSHGASMGALDNNALFYLRARGLTEAAARALLVDAFIMDGLNGLAEPLQPLVRSEVVKWLEAQHG